MSIDNDLWRALYTDVVKEAEAHRIRAHEKALRVIKLESQRRSLIAHLKWAAKELIERDVGTGKQYLKVAEELEREYVEENKPVSIEPLREAAGKPTPEHGSSRPAGSAQAQAPAGAAQGVCYMDLPAAVRQQQWDSVAPAAGDVA